MESLNSSQKQAVMYNEGPSLVIAGAGSGKTKVLTYKVTYLIDVVGVKPYNILALTFTNKAAGEMKERIAAMVDEKSARQLNMGTFHSIFAKILRTEAESVGLAKDYTIMDADDSKKLVKDIIKEMKLDEKLYKYGTVSGKISMAKNALITYDKYKADYPLVRVNDIYKEYETRKKVSNAIDFDDMLLLTEQLFANHPDILEKYQNKFQFILVDEYQDTNFAQYCIIRQLAEKHHKVCVVGDDAQSIYSFRGANIDNILKFTANYPEAKTFKLERNYRSTQNIVAAANSIIRHNARQISKDVYSENEAGEKLCAVETSSDRSEAEFLTSDIKRVSRITGDSYSKFAVLYRTNSQSRVLEEYMHTANIPYVVYGGHSFYQRAEIKDVLAYLKLIVNTSDEISLTRIINKPARGIGASTIAKVAEVAHTQNVSMFSVVENPLKYALDVNGGTAKKLTTFASLIRSYQDKRTTMDAYNLAQEVVFGTGIMDSIDADNKAELESKRDNVKELLSSIKQFVEEGVRNEDNAIDIYDYINSVVLLTDADEDAGDMPKVTLMTIHAAKGLEFNHIYIVGAEEGLFPCQSAMLDNRELEEERRLMYVAITRAKKRCTISYADARFRNGKMEYPTRSRFIKEIETRYIDEKNLGGGSKFDFSRQDESFFSRMSRPVENTFVQSNPKTYIHRNLKKVDPVCANEPVKADNNITSGLKVGTRINHQRFGNGVVMAVEGLGNESRITVNFDSEGKKVLLLKYAKFTIL
ncbi:MAG: UvrD-helicase domain-containing protein [Paludibacteraceae bacterium]|nr:UvrD-helicase domain-containing protein [Paludibacteraceae bacterium]